MPYTPRSENIEKWNTDRRPGLFAESQTNCIHDTSLFARFELQLQLHSVAVMGPLATLIHFWVWILHFQERN